MARNRLYKYECSGCPSLLMDHGSPTITTLSIVLHNGQSDVTVVLGHARLLRLNEEQGKGTQRALKPCCTRRAQKDFNTLSHALRPQYYISSTRVCTYLPLMSNMRMKLAQEENDERRIVTLLTSIFSEI